MKNWRQVQRLPLQVHTDARGSLYEVWRADEIGARLGLPGLAPFAQVTFSSSHHNVLRGLHYQAKRAQGKLLQVLAGEIWDVAVDMRHGSPTMGSWQAVRLAADAPELLWIPPGYAHGFYVPGPPAQLLYYATTGWRPEDDLCIAWNDPTLAIKWPLQAPEPVLSPRDMQGLAYLDAPRHA